MDKLASSNNQNYLDFKEARKFVHSLKLSNQEAQSQKVNQKIFLDIHNYLQG